MCLVLFELDARQFFSKRIALLLSWFRILLVTLTPWAIMNSLVHKIWAIISSTATNSPMVELWTFAFCLVNVATAHPVPIVKAPHVWPLIFWCAANKHPHANATLQSWKLLGSMVVLDCPWGIGSDGQACANHPHQALKLLCSEMLQQATYQALLV